MVLNKKMLKEMAVPVLFMAFIFVLSSIPILTDGGAGSIQALTDLNPVIQNLGHIPLYGVLVFLWLRFFDLARFPLKQVIIFSLLTTIAFGCFDEFHQSFVRGRHCDFLDVLLDSIGAVLGTAFFAGPWRKFSQK